MPIDPQDFKFLWQINGYELFAFPEGAFVGVDIPLRARKFLSCAGLPRSAAPFLSFEAPKSGPLPSVAKEWGIDEKFSRHYSIGFNGSGEPIAIIPTGVIVCLNHDLDFDEAYINESPALLAESLLRYRDLVMKTQEIGGPDAFLNRLVPAELKARFIDFLLQVDPRALDRGSMWAEEMQMI